MKSNPRAIAIAFCLILLLPACARAYYSPDRGRWISRDPIEERGGPNVHAFVGNDPQQAIDVLGRSGKSACPDCNNHCIGVQMKCKLKSGPKYSPSGTIKATARASGRKDATFTFEATFEHDIAEGACAGCCEVRQEIKWSSNENRPANGEFEPGELFLPETWYEDRDDDGNCYGHRDGKADNGNLYYTDSTADPDSACGRKYMGVDVPKTSRNLTGWWKYRLRVIDRCNDDKQIAQSDELTVEW